MSKPRTVKNWDDAWLVVNKFYGDRHMMCNAIVQLIEREKVRVLNNYLQDHNEPLLPTDPPHLPGGQQFQWLIDVPKEWYRLVGKDKS
jgi:hypothetical protein